jgi:RNA polymerase sigma-70 factor (ECF subfamily)
MMDLCKALVERTDDPLLAVYLERRHEMIRYFQIRLRSEEAARDLVQDIYVKIADRPSEPIGNPGAFLYRIGANLMLDRIKMRKRAGRRDAEWRGAETTSAGGQDIAREAPADETLAAKQHLQRILEVVNALPPQAREAFRLHKLEGLTHAETAAAMGLSRSSIEKYMMLALRNILLRVGR